MRIDLGEVWVLRCCCGLVMIKYDDFEGGNFLVKQVYVSAAEVGEYDKFGFVGNDFVYNFFVYPLCDANAEPCVPIMT